MQLKKLVAEAPAKIAKLQAKLDSVDETIGMHELQVDLEQLPPRQKKAVVRVGLPYGAIAKTIWATLRENGNQPLKTSRFTQALIVDLRDSGRQGDDASSASDGDRQR